MQKGNLSREQAIAIVGIKSVKAVEAENCEPTGRVGYNGGMRGDDTIEWSASVRVTDADGDQVTLAVYYYTEQGEIDAAGDDLSNVAWEIAGYEVN